MTEHSMTEHLSRSESETLALAADFAATLRPGDVVALRGPLGAGKTLFSRGVARALGYEGPVSSPSYALIHEYDGRQPVYHMDLYRLADGADWEEIGLGHYLHGDGICLVEWPERLPPDADGGSPFTHEVTLSLVNAEGGEVAETLRRVAIRKVQG
ncbi:MAG TPA: tRNA (adenosine(37)-N6)-threonylcarbamoyltransferase complex ATPase subunit type 1 TsaE [Fibrobacteria bacterium]|nr:tRNA (adenosine(37)-N6)-threonylcarbamoyltransferase complex ATPase subunit type 1 TsaE [Fibrobacteria bacterium]